MYSWNPATPIRSVGAWGEAFTSLHGASRVDALDPGVPWAARLDWQRSAGYGLVFCSGGKQQVNRQARHIRSDPRGTHELLVPLAGAAQVEQDRSSIEIRPGDLALCDVDRPLAFAHDVDFRSVSFLMPTAELAARSPAALRGAHLLNGAAGLGRVVRQMVTTMQEEREQFAETAFDSACDRLLELLCVAVDGETDSAPAGHRATVEAQIRRYVRRHACDSDLDVAGVARALGWSPRYIQQVLQTADTTPRDLIRHERLRLAHARLVDPGWASATIGQIAYACGFGSHAAFATAFRAEFGTTPRAARMDAQAKD